MSFAFHRSANDWLMNDKIMIQVGEAIMEDVPVVRDYDVPYVAGYSNKRDKMAIDHAFPRGFDYEGEFFDVTPAILIHETTEDGLIKLVPRLAYQLGHQPALHVERAYVLAKKVPWGFYNAWCMKQIKIIGSRKRYDHCPSWLDLKPYQDEEDWATLKKMYAEGRPLWDGKKVHPDVR